MSHKYVWQIEYFHVLSVAFLWSNWSLRGFLPHVSIDLLDQDANHGEEYKGIARPMDVMVLVICDIVVRVRA
jgi:hypothetical protein